MSEIAIIHDKLEWGGGGAVLMNIAQTLQNDHEISLITAKSKDIEDLNEYYSTSVSKINIREYSILEILDRVGHFRKLGNSTLSRLVDTLWSNIDLVINTTSDVKVNAKSITYVHGPYQIQERKKREREHSGISKYYLTICKYVESEEKRRPTYVANSKWTSRNISNTLGEQPRVVYPPVYTEDIEPVKWNERENKIITIGRISPEKNILRNIRIVRKVVNRGHDLHYHIVGPRQGDKSNYVRKVEEKAEKMDFIHLEGKVKREKLSSMISSFKWGLHGHDSEHFGITVAELVAGGAIPFVVNDGGQVEIVNNCKEILYGSENEAVEKMTEVMRNKKVIKEIRSKLPDIDSNFGVRRFRREVKSMVEGKLKCGQ